jgi:putrescine aminotransferase
MPAVNRAAAPDAGRSEVHETLLWHSQAHMPTIKRREIVLARGEGAYVWDEQDRKLLDAPASLWYCNVGHGRREIADAVSAQMRRLESYSTFQRYATRPALDIAARLAELAPVNNPKIFLTSGGSDAVETAVKLTRRYWSAMGRPEKRAIVTRDKAYHGLHGFGTSITGLDFNRDGLGPLLSETMRVPTHDAEAFANLVERDGERVAAFFCEPVVGTGGVLNPVPGYLERVQQVCKENDIAFVLDEVITGFGRTGQMFAAQRFNLEPDILLVAKGITSGYLPLGATIVGERYWEPFWNDGTNLVFRHGVTYAGHASACAAALANIDIIQRENLVERVRALEPVLEGVLTPLAAHPLVAEVRAGVGLLAGIQLHDVTLAERVAEMCIDNGVLMRIITDGTLQISPPFIIEPNELELLACIIGDALDAASP